MDFGAFLHLIVPFAPELHLKERLGKVMYWIVVNTLLSDSSWFPSVLLLALFLWLLTTPWPKWITTLRQKALWAALGLSLSGALLTLSLYKIVAFIDNIQIDSPLNELALKRLPRYFPQDDLSVWWNTWGQGCVLASLVILGTGLWASNLLSGGCSEKSQGNLTSQPQVSNFASYDSLVLLRNCTQQLTDLSASIKSEFKDLAIELRTQAVQLLTLEEKLVDMASQLTAIPAVVETNVSESPTIKSLLSLVNRVSPLNSVAISAESPATSTPGRPSAARTTREVAVTPVVTQALRPESPNMSVRPKKSTKFIEERPSPPLTTETPISRDSSSEEENSSTSSDSDSEYAMPANSHPVGATSNKLTPKVHPVLIAQKRPKRPSQRRTPLPEAARELFPITDTLEELRAQVKKFSEDIKEIKKQEQKLTPTEAALSKGELERRWSEERHAARYGARNADLLTEEEKGLTRRQLREKLAQENRERWVQQQLAKGYKLYRCEACGRYEREGEQHFCMRTSWSAPIERRQGVPFRREMLMTGGATGMSVRQAPAVDLDRLTKDHENMMKMKEKLQEQERIKNTLHTQSGSTATGMTDVKAHFVAASSSIPSSSSLPSFYGGLSSTQPA